MVHDQHHPFSLPLFWISSVLAFLSFDLLHNTPSLLSYFFFAPIMNWQILFLYPSSL